VLVVAVAVGALVTLDLLPLPPGGAAGGSSTPRRGSVGIYRCILGIRFDYGYYDYVGWRSVFTDCVSAAPPREVYTVYSPRRLIIFRIRSGVSAGAHAQSSQCSPVGPTPRPRDALQPARESDE